MEKWIKIIENDSFIVEFNKATNTYRVSYFEDCHFKDEICFRGYKELEWKEEAPETEKTWTTDELQELIGKAFKPPYVYQDTDGTIASISDACKTCPNHPSNGGSGICNCTLGLQPITCDTPYTTHTTMITDGCAAKSSECVVCPNDPSNIVENSQWDMDKLKLSKEAFEYIHCKNCGSQRCLGIGTEWFEGCVHKNELKEEVKINETLD